MARLPRWIPPHSLVELSNRCIQGRFLLRPSPPLNRIVLGVLGRALERYPSVTLHAATFLSNHYHLLATMPSAGVMARFMAYLDRNLSLEIGRLHHWRGTLWARRYSHSVVDAEETIQVQRLRYLLAQGGKEGLVLRPRDWPGIHSVEALTTGQPLEGLWYDRTAIWAARRRRQPFDPRRHTAKTSVELQPLPCWAHLPEARWRGYVAELVAAIEADTRDHHARHGTRPARRAAILAQKPHHRPDTVAWSPAPRVFAASRERRWALWRTLDEVLTAYWEAARELATGQGPVRFPAGTFPPQRAYVPNDADLALGLA